MKALGIDIGGSAIKGAIVNMETGKFEGERYRIETSQPAPLYEVVVTFRKMVAHFAWNGPIGCGFPAAIQNGVVMTASNIDKEFIGVNISQLLGNAVDQKVTVLNDADAAGMAELNFGAVSHFRGLAIFLTIGTGIGSAIINGGTLTPNSELGHLYMKDGMIAERYTSDAARKREGLDWNEWGRRFNKYLCLLDSLFYPELIIIGGGTSRRFDNFRHLLTTKAKVVPAQLFNNAGIVGAALSAFRANQFDPNA